MARRLPPRVFFRRRRRVLASVPATRRAVTWRRLPAPEPGDVCCRRPRERTRRERPEHRAALLPLGWGGRLLPVLAYRRHLRRRPGAAALDPGGRLRALGLVAHRLPGPRRAARPGVDLPRRAGPPAALRQPAHARARLGRGAGRRHLCRGAVAGARQHRRRPGTDRRAPGHDAVSLLRGSGLGAQDLLRGRVGGRAAGSARDPAQPGDGGLRPDAGLEGLWHLGSGRLPGRQRGGLRDHPLVARARRDEAALRARRHVVARRPQLAAGSHLVSGHLDRPYRPGHPRRPGEPGGGGQLRVRLQPGVSGQHHPHSGDHPHPLPGAGGLRQATPAARRRSPSSCSPIRRSRCASSAARTGIWRRAIWWCSASRR